METLYYYLDGREQKGPFSINQLKSCGLKPDTLVWTETFDNWKQLKDVPELFEILQKFPPPPPPLPSTEQNVQTPISSTNTANIDKSLIFKDNNVKLWTTIKVFGLVILLIGLVILIGYVYVNNKKLSFKNELNGKIDNIFNSKTVILDGISHGAQGSLEESSYSKFSKSSGKGNKSPQSVIICVLGFQETNCIRFTSVQEVGLLLRS